MRLFTAIDLPETLRMRLCDMMGGVPGARWVEDENLHLTLRFIGDVDPRTADDIDAGFSGVAARPFDLTVSGLGSFGTPPRVLWAGLRKSDALLRLVDKVDTVLTRLKIDFDRKRYAPHVTLARLRDAPERNVADYIRTHNDFPSEPFTVTRFVLYSSHRGNEGVTYVPERYYVF